MNTSPHSEDAYQLPHIRHLFDESPLVVQPRLAAIIGLEEAIFVQQLRYWLRPNMTGGKIVDGRKWVYNTADQWTEQFPFWTARVVRRIVGRLEKAGIVLTRQDLNDSPRDRTKWYSIDFDRLNDIIGAGDNGGENGGIPQVDDVEHASYQIGNMEVTESVTC